MPRRTSKRVKEVVDYMDKMCLLAVVRLSESVWGDTQNCMTDNKRKFVSSAG